MYMHMGDLTCLQLRRQLQLGEFAIERKAAPARRVTGATIAIWLALCQHLFIRIKMGLFRLSFSQSQQLLAVSCFSALFPFWLFR